MVVDGVVGQLGGVAAVGGEEPQLFARGGAGGLPPKDEPTAVGRPCQRAIVDGRHDTGQPPLFACGQIGLEHVHDHNRPQIVYVRVVKIISLRMPRAEFACLAGNCFNVARLEVVQRNIGFVGGAETEPTAVGGKLCPVGQHIPIGKNGERIACDGVEPPEAGGVGIVHAAPFVDEARAIGRPDGCATGGAEAIEQLVGLTAVGVNRPNVATAVGVLDGVGDERAIGCGGEIEYGIIGR